jgi:hypothetical protein
VVCGSLSETAVQIAIVPTSKRTRVEECNRGTLTPQCHITSMILHVEGVLKTADEILDETFALDLRTETLDELVVSNRVEADELTGSLPSKVSNLSSIEWMFGVTPTAARFEVFVVTDESGRRLVSRPAKGGRFAAGHTWGVEADLDDARRRQ